MCAGRIEDASDQLLVALAHAPDNCDARLLYARCCRKAGDIEEAKEVLRGLLDDDPAMAEAHFEQGLVAQTERNVDAALDAYSRTVLYDPGRAAAWTNLGVIHLNQRGDIATAKECLERAISIEPASVEANVNLALVMQYADSPGQAVSHLEHLLQAHPDDANVHWHLALALLMQRDYANGWKHHEWRDRILGGVHSRRFPYAAWRGQPLAGNRILVYGEQGLGDEIMFASCLPGVVSTAEQCIVECHERLAPLMARSFPEAVVYGANRDGDRSWLAKVEHIDYQSAIGSLPLYLRSSVNSFPQSGGYLKADPRRVEVWRQRLDAMGAGAKVGISWRGGSVDTQTRLRSMTIEHLGPVLRGAGVHWYSLQYGATPQELRDLRETHGVSIHDHPDIPGNLDETAALMCALDLIVTVDNTNVHLAGALGCPARVLVSALPDWRYGRSGNSIDWYPGVTLFRQKQVGVWEDVWRDALSGIS